MIVNETRGRVWHGKVRLADSFFRRFRGLMLVENVDYALVFLLPAETRASASIHTLFMLSDIDVIWLDSSRRVVDFRRAGRWRLYIPDNPARYVIEGPVGLVKALEVSRGDLISWQADEEKRKAVPMTIPLPGKVSFESSNNPLRTGAVGEERA